MSQDDMDRMFEEELDRTSDDLPITGDTSQEGVPDDSGDLGSLDTTDYRKADKSDEPEGDDVDSGDLDPSTLNLAASLGFSDSVAKALHKAGALDQAISERAQAQYQQMYGQPMPPGMAQNFPAGQYPPNQQQYQQQPPEAPLPTKFEAKLESDFSNLPEVFEQVTNHLNSQFAQLQETAVYLHDLIQQQGHQEFSAWFTDSVSRLGDDWSDVFGNGSQPNQPWSPQAMARQQLQQAFQWFSQANPQLPRSQVFDLALRSLHPGKYTKTRASTAQRAEPTKTRPPSQRTQSGKASVFEKIERYRQENARRER